MRRGTLDGAARRFAPDSTLLFFTAAARRGIAGIGCIV